MNNPFTKRSSSLKRTAILTVVALLVLGGIGIFLRISIMGSVERIKDINAKSGSATQKADIAQIVRSSLKGREGLADEIKGLIPPLTDVQSLEGRIEQVVRPMFTKAPRVDIGGSSPDKLDQSIRVVQFTIKGRMRMDNFDEVLRRINQFPVLLEINTATLDLGAIASPNEGEGVFLGTIFARKTSFE